MDTKIYLNATPHSEWRPTVKKSELTLFVPYDMGKVLEFVMLLVVFFTDVVLFIHKEDRHRLCMPNGSSIIVIRLIQVLRGCPREDFSVFSSDLQSFAGLGREVHDMAWGEIL